MTLEYEIQSKHQEYETPCTDTVQGTLIVALAGMTRAWSL